jgi:hypothetical protein
MNGGSSGGKDNSGDSNGDDDDDNNNDNDDNNNKDEMPLPPRPFTIRMLCANQAADMLLHIPATLQISTHVLTGRVAGLSKKSNMDIGSNPTARYLSCCRHIADMSANGML